MSEKILKELLEDTSTNMSFMRRKKIAKIEWYNNKVYLSILGQDGRMLHDFGLIAKDTGPYLPTKIIEEKLESIGLKEETKCSLTL